MTAVEEQAAEVLDDHRRGESSRDCIEGIGWVWACWCDCGWHGPDRDHVTHVAAALMPLIAEAERAAAERALRNPYDEDGHCEGCGNGSWKAHAPECAWADLRDARVEAWDEGYTCGNRHNGRRDANPYRERADTYAEGGERDA